jgi:hypothetical protein
MVGQKRVSPDLSLRKRETLKVLLPIFEQISNSKVLLPLV